MRWWRSSRRWGLTFVFAGGIRGITECRSWGMGRRCCCFRFGIQIRMIGMGLRRRGGRRVWCGDGWVKNEVRWEGILGGRFTGDNNPAMNVDAGIVEERFGWVTGGETKNVGVKLGEGMKLSSELKRSVPEGLPEI